jgi:Tfp pilus assembly protein PilP
MASTLKSLARLLGCEKRADPDLEELGLLVAAEAQKPIEDLKAVA